MAATYGASRSNNGDLVDETAQARAILWTRAPEGRLVPIVRSGTHVALLAAMANSLHWHWWSSTREAGGGQRQIRALGMEAAIPSVAAVVAKSVVGATVRLVASGGHLLNGPHSGLSAPESSLTLGPCDTYPPGVDENW